MSYCYVTFGQYVTCQGKEWDLTYDDLLPESSLLSFHPCFGLSLQLEQFLTLCHALPCVSGTEMSQTWADARAGAPSE